MLGKPLHITIALLAALATSAAPAQTNTAAPARSASAAGGTARPAATNPPPTGTVDPDPHATTQISIPLRKTPGSPASVGAKRATEKSAGGGIDDTTARCQAQPTEAARAECLDAARKRSPGR